jgi:tetratricopeptide (TPR) repeat protein
MMKRHMMLLLLVISLSACSGFAQRNNAGNRSVRNQDYDNAIESYQNAQALDPDHAEAYFNSATAYVALDEPERAIEALYQALKYADNDMKSRIYYNLGIVYYNLNKCGDAFEAFQQALLLKPDDNDARYNLELSHYCNILPTPTALEQQTEPESGQSDPDTTPTNEPGGFDGPTPTPPPQEFDLTATPVTGQGSAGSDDSLTPIPQSEGEMTVEQAESLLDEIAQDQQSLREYLQDEASFGDVSEKDW